MVVTPASSAAMMPGLPWQCAATARSASPATSTMARSSGLVNCWWIGSSTSDSTPPDAQTLITLALRRSCSLTARMQSLIPSASRSMPSNWANSWIQDSGKECKSPWPPVVLDIAPAG